MKAAMFKDQIKIKNEMEIYLKKTGFLLFYLPCLVLFFLLKPHKKEKKNQDENQNGLCMLSVIKAPIK